MKIADVRTIHADIPVRRPHRMSFATRPLLLAGDVVRQPVQYADGCILGLDGPGLGVEVDETALAEWSRR